MKYEIIRAPPIQRERTMRRVLANELFFKYIFSAFFPAFSSIRTYAFGMYGIFLLVYRGNILRSGGQKGDGRFRGVNICRDRFFSSTFYLERETWWC